MILSRILMVLALAVLAYLVWITMNSSETPKVTATSSAATGAATEPTAPTGAAQAENFGQTNQFKSIVPKEIKKSPIFQEKFIQNIPVENIVYDSKENISYEHFVDVAGISDAVHGAAPFGANQAVNEGDMATVNYTGLADAKPGDVIQIEGTDLLTAPLVDNMLYTNSIANTNRNASQDLRGDIPLQFNDTYTPFYSSVIYGAPLSEKQMTISKM